MCWYPGPFTCSRYRSKRRSEIRTERIVGSSAELSRSRSVINETCRRGMTRKWLRFPSLSAITRQRGVEKSTTGGAQKGQSPDMGPQFDKAAMRQPLTSRSYPKVQPQDQPVAGRPPRCLVGVMAQSDKMLGLRFRLLAHHGLFPDVVQFEAALVVSGMHGTEPVTTGVRPDEACNAATVPLENLSPNSRANAAHSTSCSRRLRGEEAPQRSIRYLVGGRRLRLLKEPSCGCCFQRSKKLQEDR